MQQSDVTRPNLTHPVEVQCENMRCLGNEELYELIVQLFIRLVLHNLLSPARGKRAARAQARSKERVNKKTCGKKLAVPKLVMGIRQSIRVLGISTPPICTKQWRHYSTLPGLEHSVSVDLPGFVSPSVTASHAISDIDAR
jgi:hypothetical protein